MFNKHFIKLTAQKYICPLYKITNIIFKYYSFSKYYSL